MIFFIIAIVVLIVGGFIAYCCYDSDYTAKMIVTLVISALIIGVCVVMGLRSNSFQRYWKDIKSDNSDGIHREIIITAEDGREIYHYEGTIDLEIDADKHKIKFEDEDGKRQIILYGVQDTVTIIEK